MQIWILSTEGLLVNKRDFRSWAKFPFLIMSNILIGFVALTSIRANFVRYGQSKILAIPFAQSKIAKNRDNQATSSATLKVAFNIIVILFSINLDSNKTT